MAVIAQVRKARKQIRVRGGIPLLVRIFYLLHDSALTIRVYLTIRYACLIARHYGYTR